MSKRVIGIIVDFLNYRITDQKLSFIKGRKDPIIRDINFITDINIQTMWLRFSKMLLMRWTANFSIQPHKEWWTSDWATSYPWPLARILPPLRLLTTASSLSRRLKRTDSMTKTRIDSMPICNFSLYKYQKQKIYVTVVDHFQSALDS